MEAIAEAKQEIYEEEIFAQAQTILEGGDRDGDPMRFNEKIAAVITLLGQARVPEINNYHFNMGDSDTGVIGMCCQIIASSKRQAVKRVEELLTKLTDDNNEIQLECSELAIDERITIYISPQNATHEYIDHARLLE